MRRLRIDYETEPGVYFALETMKVDLDRVPVAPLGSIMGQNEAKYIQEAF